MPINTTCKTDKCRRWAQLNEDGFCPKCQHSSNNNDEYDLEEDQECSHCNEKINGEFALACDCCHKWFDINCVGSSMLKDVLTKQPSNVILGGIKWICNKCILTFNEVCYV